VVAKKSKGPNGGGPFSDRALITHSFWGSIDIASMETTKAQRRPSGILTFEGVPTATTTMNSTSSTEKNAPGQTVLPSDDDTEEQREQRRHARRVHRKLVRRMAALGLNEHGQPLDGEHYALSQYPVRECVVILPGFADPIALNPVVTILGVMGLWSMVVWLAGTFITVLCAKRVCAQLCVVRILTLYASFFLVVRLGLVESATNSIT
jgi:hypothetical protein